MDPQRLKEGGASAFELAVLRAAERDIGSERAMRRALAAVGAATMMAAPAAGAVSKGATAMLVAKWLGAGAVVGIGFGATAAAVRAHHGAPVISEPTMVASGLAVRGGPARGLDPGDARFVVAEPVSLPGHAAPPVPTEAKPRKAAQRAPNGVASAATPVPSTPVGEPHAQLTREIALLDRARAALGQGDGAQALSILDQRQREVGKGMLGPEATVTLVQALLEQKDRARALAVAEEFLAAHPGGPHADRLRSLLARPLP